MATVSTWPEIEVLSQEDSKLNTKFIHPRASVNTTAFISPSIQYEGESPFESGGSEKNDSGRMETAAWLDTAKTNHNHFSSQNKYSDRQCSDEEMPQQMAFEDAPGILDWFNCVFSQVAKRGFITLKDFKHIAKSCDVSQYLNVFFSQLQVSGNYFVSCSGIRLGI